MRNKILLAWSGLLALTLASTAISATHLQQSKKLTASLSKAELANQRLSQALQELQTKFSALRTQYDSLQNSTQALTQDRDNILAQFKRSMEGKEEMVTERELMEKVLKRTSQEVRSLKGQLEPLQQEHEQIQEEYAKLLQERSALQAKLADAMDRSKEANLANELGELKLAQQQAADALRKAELRAKQLESEQADAKKQLATTQHRFDTLQERYTTIMSENTTLKRQSKHVPGEVARLAKQHEKLVKETADMHYNLGVLFTRSKQFYQAATEFRKVIEMRPDDAEAYYNLGVIYAESLSDRDKALEYFRKFMQLNPRGTDANWVKQYITSWRTWEAKDRLE